MGYKSWVAIVKQIGNISRYPCPLLENDTCVVYDARPSICRLYGYHLLSTQGEAYWCDRVEEAVREHQKEEKVQSILFDWAAERMKEVLVGDVKPIVAWLAES